MQEKPLRIPNSNKKKKDVNQATFSQIDLDLAKKEFMLKSKDKETEPIKKGNNF
jgi:hypothetical protein